MPPAAKNGMADAMPFFEAVKKDSFLTKGGLPDCSARAVRLRRTARTFAGREVFSSPHMSPKKMIGLSFAAAAAKLYEVFDKQPVVGFRSRSAPRPAA